MSLFRPLQPPHLEATARALEPLPATAGRVLIREGEVGDSFYAIASGTVRVQTKAGFTTTLGRGEGFGEIALLRGVPRTATVTAETDALLYRLSRDDFLTAVTGMAETHEAAEALAQHRLAEQVVFVGAAP
jgi:CRP-like cAMP-binding protein